MRNGAWQSCDMRQVVARFLIILLITDASSGMARAQSNEGLTRAAEEAGEAKTIAIKREIETQPDHAWAGDYYAGDGLGSNIRIVIAPHEGFVFEEHGCLGVYDRNLGSVSEKDGRLTFAFRFTPGARSSIAKEVVPVRWGKRRYLVPVDEMREFCGAVNRGREPRNDAHGLFLLRDGDEKFRVNAFPEVPPEFRKLLTKHRIDGEVVELARITKRASTDDAGFMDTAVAMDIGTQDGVRVGMILYVVRPYRSADSVEILSTETNRCEGIVTQNVRKEQRPQVGWKVSTKPWW